MNEESAFTKVRPSSALFSSFYTARKCAGLGVVMPQVYGGTDERKRGKNNMRETDGDKWLQLRDLVGKLSGISI